MAASYIDSAYFTDWAAPFTITDPAELARVLERASRDIDRYCGPWEQQADGSLFGDLSVNPRGLGPAQINSLRRATAAQAYYRLRNGEDWALGGGDLYDSTTGPDFTATGRRPRVSPLARDELTGSGLLVRSGRIRFHR